MSRRPSRCQTTRTTRSRLGLSLGLGLSCSGRSRPPIPSTTMAASRPPAAAVAPAAARRKSGCGAPRTPCECPPRGGAEGRGADAAAGNGWPCRSSFIVVMFLNK
eukprot:6484671-Alexandrium_andersonii.AAC.1